MDEEPRPVNAENEYGLAVGKNLANHSTSLAGLGTFVRQSVPTVPTFRTRQAAFRYAAHLVNLANESLPDEDDPAGFDEILDVIQN